MSWSQAVHLELLDKYSSKERECQRLGKQLQGQTDLVTAIEAELADTRSSINGIESHLKDHAAEGQPNFLAEWHPCHAAPIIPIHT